MQQNLNNVISALNKVVVGKSEAINLAVCCMLAKGHLLIEDIPGMGKTTLAQALAIVFGMDYQRVQFTSDLLPSDILGVSVFDRDTSEFRFHSGPIFSQLLLADEVNRATPKTQSALLEAMAEGQVSLDGQTRPLPKPFFVIATQNPERQGGTFPLPESQLDRFTIRLQLGYPNPEAEKKILLGKAGESLLKKLPAIMSPQEIVALQQQVETIRISDAVIDYIQRLLLTTRQSSEITAGLSPRAALALVACAKSWAFIQGRDYVIPEDVQQIFAAVSGHRLRDSAHMLSGSGSLSHSVLASTEVLGS
jgi:MoxR-like ATPase|tara:strand:+ start:1316 stop:2236 length:921 start_codon:yes stop_codon:yes gene_type:complete